MRLFTFEVEDRRHLGAELQGSLVDVPAAYQAHVAFRGVPPGLPRGLPADMLSWLRLGPAGSQAARETLTFMARRPATPVGVRLTYAFEEVRLLAPVARPGKILLADGSAAPDGDPPSGPRAWSPQFGSAVIGDGEAILQPFPKAQLFSELHLALVVGRHLKHARVEEALHGIVAYSILNAVTMERPEAAPGLAAAGRTRMCDTFAPMGPVLVTPDELPAPWERPFFCRVNGELQQQGTLAGSERRTGRLLADLTTLLTLDPGDVVALSLSHLSHVPAQRLLISPGDVVEWSIEGLGTLRNSVIAGEPVVPLVL